MPHLTSLRAVSLRCWLAWPDLTYGISRVGPSIHTVDERSEIQYSIPFGGRKKKEICHSQVPSARKILHNVNQNNWLCCCQGSRNITWQGTYEKNDPKQSTGKHVTESLVVTDHILDWCSRRWGIRSWPYSNGIEYPSRKYSVQNIYTLAASFGLTQFFLYHTDIRRNFGKQCHYQMTNGYQPLERRSQIWLIDWSFIAEAEDDPILLV